ncbi:MAG: hypothetical protein ACRDJI_04230 [Actinomycetota bacterium]
MLFRIASRILTLLAVGIVASALGSATATPGKHDGATKPGGKKPIGTVAAFDPATGALTVTTNGGEELTGTLAPDAHIKIEHRGKHATGKGHGNPTAGSTDDIVAGAWVLRIKEREGLITHLRLRPLPVEPDATASDHDEPKDDSTDDSTDDAQEDDDLKPDDGDDDDEDAKAS